MYSVLLRDLDITCVRRSLSSAVECCVSVHLSKRVLVIRLSGMSWEWGWGWGISIVIVGLELHVGTH